MIRATRALLLALTVATGLAACGGSDGSPDVGSEAQVAVTNSSPESVYAGEPITFTITVTNDGPAAASDVTLEHHLSGAPAIGSITCAATGGAACPAALGESMTLASFPAGGGLIFTVLVPGAADIVGPVTSAMVVTAAADTDHSDNTGESTTLAADLRNGDYTVYASNGRQYILTLDFNNKTWAMVGAQVDQAGTFALDVNGIDYVIAGASKFRLNSDGFIVGGFDFNLFGSNHIYDHGVRPFVASRTFTTDHALLDGKEFNLLGINLRRNDTLESVASPATFVKDVLQVCLASIPVKVALCPADALASYKLAVVGTEMLGVDSVRQDSIHLRLARSGDSYIVLRSEDAADGTGRQFRVGLANTSGLAGGTFAVSSTRGLWGTTTLTDTHYAFSGTASDGTTVNETAELSALTNVSPSGIRRGNLSTDDAAPIYLSQNDPLVVMLGVADGAAEGTIDIGLR
jgi:uncharacterized repeat protein (TIGR01451 family)